MACRKLRVQEEKSKDLEESYQKIDSDPDTNGSLDGGSPRNFSCDDRLKVKKR
jgi:hypothetical protein